MKTRILIIGQGDSNLVVRSRTLARNVVRDGMPKCAWCRHNDLRHLVDIVQTGFTVDLVYAACYCDYCQLATIVVYEVPIEGDEEKIIDET